MTENDSKGPRNLDADLQKEIDDALGDQSIEELMAREVARPAEAESDTEGVRRGRVVAVQGDDIFVDLGGKDQGVVPAKQFEDEPLPAEGDPIEVTVEGYDETEGLLVLSRKGAVMAVTRDSLEVGQIVEARVTKHNKGGLEVSVNGIRGFMPASQVERFHVEDLSEYVDRKLKCEVTDITEGGRNVIVSQRSVLEAEAEEARRRTLGELDEGQIVPGVVRSIMPYGAFVDIGGADGLLHISDMSYSRVEDPNDIVQEGQQIEVKVLKIDRESDRISLGLKQTMQDPWETAASRWPVDSMVTGRITKLMDFGAFVELDDGIEGLIPIGELTYGRRIRHPREVVDEGETVKVRVLSVDTERKRISLSLKRTGEDPWMGASVRWPAESITEGLVTRLTDFGAFVELAPGVEGLIHISELAEEHVKRPGDVVREGQTVRVKVLDVDEERRRISLSLKQAGEEAAPETSRYETPAQPERKRKRPLKGGLD